MIRIKELSVQERPREKLIRYGPSSLSNIELLAIIIGNGSRNESALDISAKLLSRYTLRELSTAGVSQLKEVLGVKDAKACSIVAAFELGRRAWSYTGENYEIKSVEDVVRLFPEMRHIKQEVLKAVFLNSRLGLIKTDVISVGGLNTNSVEPREVFRPAVLESAAGIILVHNHPSGDPTPSERDVKFTKEVLEAGRVLGIELLDHIIIGDGKFVSLKEEGIL